MHQTLGFVLVAVGILVAILGLLVWAGGLGWFGSLPGDLRWEGERSRVYIPVTSMILLSVALSLVLWLVRRLL